MYLKQHQQMDLYSLIPTFTLSVDYRERENNTNKTINKTNVALKSAFFSM